MNLTFQIRHPSNNGTFLVPRATCFENSGLPLTDKDIGIEVCRLTEKHPDPKFSHSPVRRATRDLTRQTDIRRGPDCPNYDYKSMTRPCLIVGGAVRRWLGEISGAGAGKRHRECRSRCKWGRLGAPPSSTATKPACKTATAVGIPQESPHDYTSTKGVVPGISGRIARGQAYGHREETRPEPSRNPPW